MHGVIESGAGYANAAGLGHGFQPCGDIDAVAVNVIAFGDDVAQVYADAQLDAAGIGGGPIVNGHGALDGGGAFDGIDDAGEFDQRAVAHELDDAAMEACYRRVDHLPAAQFQPRQRAGLILAHEAAVAGDIGHEDGSQPAFQIHMPLR